MNFAQEFVTAGHAASHLTGHHRAVAHDAADHELVRHILDDHFACAVSGAPGAQTACLQFTVAGTYPWECVVHAGMGMTGTLTVN